MSKCWFIGAVLGCLALATPAQAQTFYGSRSGGFGVIPGGDPTGYGGGYGYGFGYAPSSAPRSYAPSYMPSYPGLTALPSLPSPSALATGNGQPGRVYLDVHVPASAELWFEGHKMSQTGTHRYFWSPRLAPNRRYAYTVKARWMQDGQPVERTRDLVVQAGERQTVDLTSAP